MMIGTPYYMSPEQTQAKDIDPRADLWSIAVIAFECLTGNRPFLGDSFGELVICINTKPIPVPSQQGVVPAGFDEWFVKATQRDRERRFQSAREMADELAKVGGAVGAAAKNSVQRTLQTPAVVPRAAAPVGPAAPSVTPAPKDLQLTTGARSVTSRSVGGGATRSPLVLSLVGLATLIVVGAGAFVALGGPRALLHSGEAAVTPVISEAPPVAAVLPPQVEPAAVAPLKPAAASPSVAPAPSVVPSGAVAVKKEPEAPAEKRAPSKKTGAAAPPNKGANNGANPAPPKDWNF